MNTETQYMVGKSYLLDDGLPSETQIEVVTALSNKFVLVKACSDPNEYEWVVDIHRLSKIPNYQYPERKDWKKYKELQKKSYKNFFWGLFFMVLGVVEYHVGAYYHWQYAHMVSYLIFSIGVLNVAEYIVCLVKLYKF